MPEREDDGIRVSSLQVFVEPPILSRFVAPSALPGVRACFVLGVCAAAPRVSIHSSMRPSSLTSHESDKDATASRPSIHDSVGRIGSRARSCNSSGRRATRADGRASLAAARSGRFYSVPAPETVSNCTSEIVKRTRIRVAPPSSRHPLQHADETSRNTRTLLVF